MHGEALTPGELACLQRLHTPHAASPAYPCTPGVLDSLQRKGLVELRPGIGLPLENRGGTYVLTPRGRRLL